MRGLLELIRIVVLFGIFYMISGKIITYVYQKLDTEISSIYGIMPAISIFILFFVLYRNKLQFSGWYKGKDKLSNRGTKWLICSAVFLFILPPILHFLLY
ncbi:hypothetical protein BN1002_02075 [Bacillus sp. B-jedd]|nr:hypothetical protein BN1002_02075 [Bacillus sp. B-jedd]